MCCVLITIHDENHGESDHEHPLLHPPFLVLHQMGRSVSVVFDFNVSHNDVVPVPQLLLPFDLLKMEEWIVDGYHLCVASFVFTA